MIRWLIPRTLTWLGEFQHPRFFKFTSLSVLLAFAPLNFTTQNKKGCRQGASSILLITTFSIGRLVGPSHLDRMSGQGKLPDPILAKRVQGDVVVERL